MELVKYTFSFSDHKWDASCCQIPVQPSDGWISSAGEAGFISSSPHVFYDRRDTLGDSMIGRIIVDSNYTLCLFIKPSQDTYEDRKFAFETLKQYLVQQKGLIEDQLTKLRIKDEDLFQKINAYNAHN